MMFSIIINDFANIGSHKVLNGKATGFSYSGWLSNGKNKIKVLPTSDLDKENLILEIVSGNLSKNDIGQVYQEISA